MALGNSATTETDQSAMIFQCHKRLGKNKRGASKIEEVHLFWYISDSKVSNLWWHIHCCCRDIFRIRVGVGVSV